MRTRATATRDRDRSFDRPCEEPVVTEMSPQEWGARYSAYRDWYEWQTERLESRIIAILSTAGMDVFKVESRTKEVQSFTGKVEARNSGKEAKFGDPLREITDLVGARVITYYREDVDTVGEIIQKNFHVDKATIVDRAGDEPDRFNYKSVHFIVRLSPPTTDTRDWGPYADVRAEIQVRTALQHAWSAVQHKLDYKSEIAMPKELQRRMFRLNAVIESADVEFSQLRDERARIESTYKQDVQKGQLDMPLDEASIAAYIQDGDTGDKISELLSFRSDANIGKLDGNRLTRDRRDLLNVLRLYDITTVAQLDGYLTANILPATIPDGFFGDDRRSVEDALTVLILTDRRADRETYSKIYMQDGWNEFRGGVEDWHRQKGRWR
jgi:putative GTP pyrophosphokinase